MPIYVRFFLLTVAVFLFWGCVNTQNRLPLPLQFAANHEIDEKLIGTWKLTKLRVDDSLIPIDTCKYFLKVSPKSIRYNLEVNICTLVDWKVRAGKISADHVPCTRMCCDDRYGSNYKFLDYMGTYHINKDVLTIFSIDETTVSTLVRIEDRDFFKY